MSLAFEKNLKSLEHLLTEPRGTIDGYFVPSKEQEFANSTPPFFSIRFNVLFEFIV